MFVNCRRLIRPEAGDVHRHAHGARVGHERQGGAAQHGGPEGGLPAGAAGPTDLRAGIYHVTISFGHSISMNIFLNFNYAYRITFM